MFPNTDSNIDWTGARHGHTSSSTICCSSLLLSRLMDLKWGTTTTHQPINKRLQKPPHCQNLSGSCDIHSDTPIYHINPTTKTLHLPTTPNIALHIYSPSIHQLYMLIVVTHGLYCLLLFAKLDSYLDQNLHLHRRVSSRHHTLHLQSKMIPFVTIKSQAKMEQAHILFHML